MEHIRGEGCHGDGRHVLTSEVKWIALPRIGSGLEGNANPIRLACVTNKAGLGSC